MNPIHLPWEKESHTIVSLFNFETKKLWLPYANYKLPRRRRRSLLYFIQKKNPINPVDPVKE